jgi:hypothetical protein
MSFDFDSGSGSEGPWLQWSARGTLDGKIPAKTFLLRTQDGKEAFAGFDRGVVLDVHNMKTGWCMSDGTPGKAPEWKWNPTLSSFAPKPGDEWKKGFSVRCAITKSEAATWEQSGAAAWGAFVALVPAIQSGPVSDDKLPMVKMTGVRVEKYARGSTAIPTLEISKWVDRPDCLTADAGNIATDEPAPNAAAKAAPAPLPADMDEF